MCLAKQVVLAVAAAFGAATEIQASHGVPSEPILTRVLFQDDDTRTLKWADLRAGEPPTLGPVQPVEGFPKLDSERQTLVQMEAAQGYVLVGVRDDDSGNFQSGWVLIDTGVVEEEHGDHSHWTYPRPPQVRASVLDDKQGNPAHLYCYDNVFYLANDQLDGYTRIDPAGVKSTDDVAAIRRKASFFQGGGRHITLAVVGGTVGYSTWIDREGPQSGRVDVTALNAIGNRQIAFSLTPPHGGLHGATACQGKVFFAPADGLCWLQSPNVLPVDPKSIAVRHLSLGKDDEKARRTGGFTTFGRHVAFTMGAGKTAALGLIDAAKPEPEVTRLVLPMADANRPAGLEIAQPRKGSPMAFVFHDHPLEVEAPNRLSLVELDPNSDGNWSDAKVAQELDVGKSRVEGHGGHHSIAFDANRRRAIFSNPGSGTLAALVLQDRKQVAEWKVGGAPSKVVLVGGRESKD